MDNEDYVRIPIGPIHPAVEEPFRVTLITEGEEIKDVDVRFGYNYRGLEWIGQRRNYINIMYMAERICGICSFVHTYAYCMAVEQLWGKEVPERAHYIRAIIAELERIHSHILITAIMAHNAGFDTWFMRLMQFREKVMDVLEALTGNRVNYSIITIGGVRRDIGDKEKRILTNMLEYYKKVMPEVEDLFYNNKTIEARFSGSGVLTREEAKRWSTVGPVVRGSGVEWDLRKHAPYGVYDELDFEVVVPQKFLGTYHGDSFDRTLVRIYEVYESMRIIEEALERMPSGPIHQGPKAIPLPVMFKTMKGRAIGRAEAPRGEVLHYIWAENGEGPIRWKVRSPTEANGYALKPMLIGDQIADAPVVIASIDPCISCCDRVTVVDLEEGTKRTYTFDELLKMGRDEK